MDENFRDSINTVTKEGKRNWVYPKKPKGRYTNYRRYVSFVLLIFLFAAPWIKVNGNQFLLLNVLERKFNIFGFPFWPQDFHLLVISLITGVVFVALFTVAYGRIFCGWVCPQTIFLEMVFRPIEYWIEGDRGAQMRLNKQPWTARKIGKKVLKWTLFLLISFAISNTFVAYLIGSDQLLLYVLEGPMAHMETFVPLVLFTFAFYFVFTWFREQVCIIACPYGRLQGVLLDNKSIVVAYDHVRGEGSKGRKKFKKNEDREALGHGDCIDCLQCVHVCPTGIDIRNGTQLECVNCTACIDECDTIMEKIDKPKGLIRYASEDNISKGLPFRWNVRMMAYTAVLFVLVGVFTSMLFLRNDLEASINRLPGQLYQRTEDNRISNVYTYQLINKTSEEVRDVHFRLLSHEGEIRLVSLKRFDVPAQDLSEGTLFIEIPMSELEGDKVKLRIGVYSGEELIETTGLKFFSPPSY